MAFGVAIGLLAFDAENTQRENVIKALKSNLDDNHWCLGVKWSVSRLFMGANQSCLSDLVVVDVSTCR